MMLLGIDINSTRARAVSGTVGDFPCPVPLDPPQLELPMMLNCEGRHPVVGTAGFRAFRRLPHLVHHNFLAQLGDETASRDGRDCESALTRMLQHLRRACGDSARVTFSLPAYLSMAQARWFLRLAKKAKVPLLGSVTAPLAAALAAYAEQPWHGAALVVDVDDHALSLSLVQAVEGQAELVATRSLPALGLCSWRQRLLNCLADACIVQSRRDPRDTPAAEQMLFEQLDTVLDASRTGRMLNIAVQTPAWYQNLVLQPGDAPAYCATLLRQTLREIERVFAADAGDRQPTGIVLSASAGSLPGLVARLWSSVDQWRGRPERPALHPVVGADDEDDFGAGLLDDVDFGDGLLEDAADEPAAVQVLGADALARAAHLLAAHFSGGAIPPGHLEHWAPLPLPQSAEAGNARLHYQGQDYPLSERTFTVGKHRSCDLIVDGDVHPMVAPRHCEIHFDHWRYLLYDRSKHGTLVNDRLVAQAVALQPGDWIRLGSAGPLLRFLGQNVVRALHTTA